MPLEVMNQAPKIIQINSSDLTKLSALWGDRFSFTFQQLQRKTCNQNI